MADCTGGGARAEVEEDEVKVGGRFLKIGGDSSKNIRIYQKVRECTLLEGWRPTADSMKAIFPESAFLSDLWVDRVAGDM